MSKANAEWVLNFLKAHEATGQHAPVETMQRVVDYIVALETRFGIGPDEARSNLARDVMTTAVEGGINYWADFKGVERNHEEGSPDFLIVQSFHVRPAERSFGEGDVRELWQEVTVEKVLEAMRTITMNDTLVGSHIQSDIILGLLHDDACHIDAEGADCIVQVACFGEIVFG